jgi:thiol-disulfide isomerase/thioredoxin
MHYQSVAAIDRASGRTAIALLATLAWALVPACSGAAGPTWETDVARAFATARAADKPLLVDAYADWCGWCKVIDREVFPNPAFVALAKDFVLLRIDVEDGAEGTRLAAEHGAYSLPTLLILEPSGARSGAVVGYFPAAEYVARLKSELAIRERVLDSYRRVLASGDADALKRTAVDFYERRDGPRAAALLDRVLSISTLPAREEAWTRVFLADSWRMAGEFDKARAAYANAERAARKADELEPELGERLHLLPFWIAETAGECGRAATELASFEQRHPASPFLDEARRAMSRLRADSGPRCS